MKGTETEWGRPAESTPRWRALLDRARLGGRTGEQPEVRRGRGVDGWRRRRAEEPQPIGYPADLNYGGDPPPPAYDHSAYPGYDPMAPHGGPGYPARGQSGPSGYGVSQGHAAAAPFASASAPVRPANPSYEPLPTRTPSAGHSMGVASVPTATAGYLGATGGYPARVEWREPHVDAETERAIAILRRDLGFPRVLAFANPKGGVHKTTATVLAAATVGSVRGRGVIAWDDNELRGTLGLRAGSARHARTIRHLIADLDEIEACPGYELAERLDDYLRHASDGSYDVLAGEESPRFAQRLDKKTVRRVLELLRRTHDVICVDTGNNVESPNWQTVLQAADQLVLTTVPREDAAFTADWMLDLLHDIGMGELANNAVTLLSCPSPEPSPLLEDLRRHFATRTRAVAVVPYDPTLETGSSIDYARLLPETRQAWLRATAVMLEPFGR